MPKKVQAFDGSFKGQREKLSVAKSYDEQKDVELKPLLSSDQYTIYLEEKKIIMKQFACKLADK